MNRAYRQRVVRVALVVSSFALPLACGGRAVETRNSAATPGPSAGDGSSVGAANDGASFGGASAANGVVGGASSTFGGSAGLGGASSTFGGSAGLGGASAAGGTSGALPCRHPRPFMSDATGYVQCDDYFYRASKQICPTTWPRAGQVPGYEPGVSQCRTDADCASQMLTDAYCALPFDPPPRGTICQPGCISDSDCLENYVCLCGDPIGRCIPTQCKSDADCMPGMHCASTVDPFDCLDNGVSLACQLPKDQCTIDAQCAGGFICRIDLNDDGPPWRTCSQQCPLAP